ncbi:hypothetical protein Pyn_03321 [Prunus yedoensis var. nudiflora]|uniref:Vesicle tethering protein Uso1/P115-like head domain-containing protein n=1 Tax=Prunus yedoensis var. nudiflora TaxID=2094558 RepID=A0A314Z6Z4_PRUYE|nr:hypothetical protein Pyn_03321 [Prunus yedoensis var. nudiflora]
MNADLLSREADNISLLLSLLSEEDFYVRYYTLQLLTALLTNSPNRLQEAILTIPRGITRLMDMLMDREVIRNEALLLLTYLTREAEEIQKIVVFEGAFEKIFSIIKEEGGSDGGVVVQDCIELLNNLIRKNASNQVLLRETIGFDPFMSILKLRGSTYSFTQQKTINLLSALETLNLLIMGGSEADHGKDANMLTNRTTLVQKKVLDHLLMLGVESQWAPVAVRCAALRCIGNLIAGHPKNLDALASKFLGEGPQEPALNSILRIILRTSTSTLIPQPHSMAHAPVEEDVHMSFGSMLLQGLTLSENDGILRHAAELLVFFLMYEGQYPVQGKDSRPHITYLLELVSNSSTTVYIKGLAAVLLGECVIYNKSVESGKDAFTIVDSISQKVGLTTYFLKFDEMQKSFLFTSARSTQPCKQLTRSASASMVEIEDVDENSLLDQKNEDHPVLSSIFDAPFVNLVRSLEVNIREKIVEVYSHPKSKVAVVPAELEQKSGESDREYIKRLKAFVEKQCSEIQLGLKRQSVEKCLDPAISGLGLLMGRSLQRCGLEPPWVFNSVGWPPSIFQKCNFQPICNTIQS